MLSPAPRTFGQIAIFMWGVLGVILVVGEAAARLLRFAHTLKGAARVVI